MINLKELKQKNLFQIKEKIDSYYKFAFFYRYFSIPFDLPSFFNI